MPDPARRAVVIEAITGHLVPLSEDDYATHCRCGAHATEAADLPAHVADDILARLDAMEAADA
jgi:hypothetical protein